MSSQNKKHTLILFSAIDPCGVSFSQRNDVECRYLDTIQSLNKWVSGGLFDSIIFFDSSGYDLDRLKNSVKNTDISLEFHSVNLQSFDRSLGKGYGVYLSMKYLIDNSSLPSNSDSWVVCPARYYIKNSSNILKNSTTDIVCNLSLNLSFAFEPFFIAPPVFYLKYWDSFLSSIHEDGSLYKSLDTPRVAYEFGLARAVHRAISDGFTWALPCDAPLIEAISGSTNLHYSGGYKRILLKFYFKLKIFFFQSVR
jgi:hypothetical protein